jgi:hypothetical protein
VATRAGIGTEAEAAKAAELNQITEANYATGRQNWQFATQALSNEASILNPEGMAGQATGAGSAEGTTANEIAQENASLWEIPLGAISGVAGQAAGKWAES